jgi:DNA polymerase
MVVADSAQIEARVLAWLAGQTDISTAFANGEDVYKKMAASIYGVSEDQITKLQRFIGKIAVLGLGYGMGWRKFQNTLATGVMGPAVDIDDQEARRVVTMYRSKADKVVGMWKQAEEILSQMVRGQEGSYKCLEWDDHNVWLPNGLALHYYGITAKCDGARFFDFQYSERGKHVHTYGGKMTENFVQALARIIVGEQLLDINKTNRVVMMSHDECVALAKTKEAPKTLKHMLQIMSTPPSWCSDIVLAADGGYDRMYSK